MCMGVNKKVSFRCMNNELKKYFSTSSCSVTVSIGQCSQDGDSFTATMSRINTSFSSCSIMVCDSLQRYSLQMKGKIDASEAYQLAAKAGELWLERNNKAINSLNIPCKVYKWEAWLSNCRFQEKLALINSAYDDDSIIP